MEVLFSSNGGLGRHLLAKPSFPPPSFNLVSTASRHCHLVLLVLLVPFLNKCRNVSVGLPSRLVGIVSMVPPFALDTPSEKAKIAIIATVNDPHR